MAQADAQTRYNSSHANLFDISDDYGLTVEQAAQKANVSTATIRNWIKTGYLLKTSDQRINSESFDHFLNHVAGRDKLTNRANKSLKDSHDHDSITSHFLQLTADVRTSVETLGIEYETTLSNSYRNKEGIYYTPQSIVEDLFKKPEGNLKNFIFCDPCCGSGNFIMQAIELGFMPKNIYGYDTDPVAVEITRQRIFQKTGCNTKNIYNADFLQIALNHQPLKFDCIYTNPPWGKKLTKCEKDGYGKLFNAGKSTDTCSLFLFACLQLLNHEGTIGLLLPESFFNISTFENARAKALSLDITRMIDYGKPFKGLVTKACGITIHNKSFNQNTRPIQCKFNNKRFSRTVESFARNPKSIFNFQCCGHDAEIIRHAYSLPHITLSNRASWAMGIVTGNNRKFITSQSTNKYIPVFKGADISKGSLKEPSNYIPNDLSLYQQVAPLKYFKAKEKLIYKFISSNLCFFLDTEQRFILNSANMLIPSNDMPITATQLCNLLNSDFMNWLFKSIFNTHKILRGDLEALPIHIEYFQQSNLFDENDFLHYLGVEKVSHGAYRIKK